MPTIAFDNVEKRYGRSGPAAVAGLTLEISDGDFLCLLGPSGCGKTTTLRMLARVRPNADGRPLTQRMRELAQWHDAALDARIDQHSAALSPQHAIAGGYRFYSYGDTSLLERAA